MKSEALTDTKVTWLLAVKNGMPYLPETLASIEAQTYRNWEVLVWDNGSDDGTIEELHKWIPSRLPGEVIADKPMESLGACRAEMVKRCTTELCACIDADDVNFPERLEKQVTFLLAHPQVAAVGSQTNRIDENGVSHGLFYPLPTEPQDIVHFMMFNSPMAQPTVLFRRSAVLEAGNYRDVGKINVEDYDLWLRIAKRHQLANFAEPFINYRVHRGSTTQIALAGKQLFPAADKRFCEHGPALFGCSLREAKLLRSRRHRCAILVFFKIARHLQRTQGGHWMGKIRSASFGAAAVELVSPRDFFSRLVLSVLYPDKKALSRFLMQSIKPVCRGLGITKAYRIIKGSKP